MLEGGPGLEPVDVAVELGRAREQIEAPREAGHRAEDDVRGAQPVTDDEPLTTQIKMRPVLLFGVVPALGDFFPGWLVGYIIVVVPLVFVLKWAFNIY